MTNFLHRAIASNVSFGAGRSFSLAWNYFAVLHTLREFDPRRLHVARPQVAHVLLQQHRFRFRARPESCQVCEHAPPRLSAQGHADW